MADFDYPIRLAADFGRRAETCSLWSQRGTTVGQLTAKEWDAWRWMGHERRKPAGDR
jgi:hypothetical protein